MGFSKAWIQIAGASIQWGAWSGLGMAAQSAATLARIARSGMGLITPAQGLGALQNVLNAVEAAQLIQPEVTVS